MNSEGSSSQVNNLREEYKYLVEIKNRINFDKPYKEVTFQEFRLLKEMGHDFDLYDFFYSFDSHYILRGGKKRYYYIEPAKGEDKVVLENEHAKLERQINIIYAKFSFIGFAIWVVGILWVFIYDDPIALWIRTGFQEESLIAVLIFGLYGFTFIFPPLIPYYLTKKLFENYSKSDGVNLPKLKDSIKQIKREIYGGNYEEDRSYTDTINEIIKYEQGIEKNIESLDEENKKSDEIKNISKILNKVFIYTNIYIEDDDQSLEEIVKRMSEKKENSK